MFVKFLDKLLTNIHEKTTNFNFQLTFYNKKYIDDTIKRHNRSDIRHFFHTLVSECHYR